MRANSLGIDRVHRDRDPRQTSISQGLRHFGQQMAVGSDRNIEWLAFERLHCAQLGHHLHDALAQQRLASGETDLCDPQADKHASHAEIVGDRHLGKLRTIVARAAIDAPVVAAIGNRDPQVADAPSEFVGEKHAIRFSPFALRSCHPERCSRRTPIAQDKSSIRLKSLDVRRKKEGQRARRTAPLIVSFPSTGGVDVSLHTLGPAKLAEHRRRSPGYAVRPRRSETVQPL